MPGDVLTPSNTASQMRNFPNLYAWRCAYAVKCGIPNEEFSEFVCLGLCLLQLFWHIKHANFQICMPGSVPAPAFPAYQTTKFSNLYAWERACSSFSGISNEQIFKFACLGACLLQLFWHIKRPNFQICMPGSVPAPVSLAYQTCKFLNMYA